MTINRYADRWQDAMHQRLSAINQQFPQAHIYALVEGVLNEACYAMLKRAGGLPFSALYEYTPSADEETLAISPILVQYETEGRHTWDMLLKKLDGKPALSLIVTPEPLQQLTERLLPWCVVDAADHTLALSFADTRILPELFNVLTPQQLEQFCGPALVWQYLARNAEWIELPLPEDEGPPAVDVRLDEQQCAQLIASAEADHVLFQLRASVANLVDCYTPARAHDLVCHWLSCADHAQIESARDRLSVCEFGLEHPGLESQPQMAEWLAMPSQRLSVAAVQTLWIQQRS
jgi:hypothetical protein